jgi:superkiller protein 3
MATLVKNKLKAARDALGKKDWAAAQTAAQQALDFEADNYNACVALLVPMRSPDSCEHRNVFLGLASLELGSYEQSEQVIFSSTPLVHDVNLMSAGVSKGD